MTDTLTSWELQNLPLTSFVELSVNATRSESACKM